MVKVNAEAKTFVPLLHQHYRIAPCTLTRVYGSSLAYLQTSSIKGSGIHLKCSLKGTLSVSFIPCLIPLEHPNLSFSKAKMLQYSRKSSLALCFGLVGHDSRPVRSSFSVRSWYLSLFESQAEKCHPFQVILRCQGRLAAWEPH